MRTPVTSIWHEYKHMYEDEWDVVWAIEKSFLHLGFEP